MSIKSNYLMKAIGFVMSSVVVDTIAVSVVVCTELIGINTT